MTGDDRAQASRAAKQREKRELRRRLAARRRDVPPEAREAASRLIAARLLERVHWPEVRAMHIYRSVDAWSEIETGPIVLKVSETWPAIEIVFPGTARDEPLPERPFDLIVVPVLGFDRNNDRLGLGAGFYDRFLATQPQALKIGLAYEWALLPDGLPREPHDIRLDEILTDAP